MVNIGAVIGGYRVLEEIGAGSYGLVYKAQSTQANGDVRAVKFLKPEHAASDKAIKMFLREAKTMANLNHPNIIDVYGYSMQPEPHFFMEYCPTGLRERQHGAMQWQEAVEITKQILGALDYTHGKRIIHRDLWPANILFDKNNKVKVSDFGLAEIVQDSELFRKIAQSPYSEVVFSNSKSASVMNNSRSEPIMGMINYASPEMKRDETITTATDIYSVGVMLYEMLTGKLLQSLETPSELNPKVPKALDDIVKRATAREPRNRFSAVQFYDVLDGLAPKKAANSRISPSKVFSYAAATISVLGTVVAGSLFGLREYRGHYSPNPVRAEMSAGGISEKSYKSSARKSREGKMTSIVNSGSKTNGSRNSKTHPKPISKLKNASAAGTFPTSDTIADVMSASAPMKNVGATIAGVGQDSPHENVIQVGADRPDIVDKSSSDSAHVSSNPGGIQPIGVGLSNPAALETPPAETKTETQSTATYPRRPGTYTSTPNRPPPARRPGTYTPTPGTYNNSHIVVPPPPAFYRPASATRSNSTQTYPSITESRQPHAGATRVHQTPAPTYEPAGAKWVTTHSSGVTIGIGFGH